VRKSFGELLKLEIGPLDIAIGRACKVGQVRLRRGVVMYVIVIGVSGLTRLMQMESSLGHRTE
jgi:hypothetical protein